MEATRNATALVRFSYEGKKYSIFTTRRSKIMTYQVFLKYAKLMFNFRTKDLQYLEVRDEHGNLFDEDTFGNYMIFFPKPRQLFSLKLNYRKKMANNMKQHSKSLEDLFNEKCAIKRNHNGNNLAAKNDFVFAVPK